MQRDDDALLLDMLLAARQAHEFTRDMTRQQFKNDERTQLAVQHTLLIIGEAGNRVSDERQHQHPEIPWREIRGLRNRIAHDYININLETVWDIVQDRIPELIIVLDQIVPPPREKD